MTRRVVVTDLPFNDLEAERGILEPLGCELEVAPGTEEQQLVEAVRGCEAVLVCYAKVTRSVIEEAARSGCKVISRYGIGYDNIDIDAATKHGILVTYVPDYCLDEVADHTMALALALAREVHRAAVSVRDGDWAVPQGAVRRLQGRRFAVIGVGGIGRRVVDRAAAFGFEIVGFDPYLENWDLQAERADSFEAAISEADFISLHVPLTEENRHLIDADSIALMKRAPRVVNTSRGPLIDLEAAVAALDSGGLSGIALDVTDPEPPPADHPVRRHDRAILTPHMAFYSVEAQAELQRRAATEIARALQSQPPDRPVNPEVTQASA